MGLTAEELMGAVVEQVLCLYRKLSDEIHKPDIGCVPIEVGFLGASHAAMMVHCCQANEVAFSMYDRGGLRVARPPPEVARLLGKGWRSTFMA